MPEIKFTSKLIVALALAKPLISTTFLEAIKNRATCNMELPDVNRCLFTSFHTYFLATFQVLLAKGLDSLPDIFPIP